jgi:hypothetical protein
MESVDLVQPVDTKAKRPPHGGLFCPLLALSGHANSSEQCPLSGVKRTCLFALRMSAFDPKRTLAAYAANPFQKASLSRYDALS